MFVTSIAVMVILTCAAALAAGNDDNDVDIDADEVDGTSNPNSAPKTFLLNASLIFR